MDVTCGHCNVTLNLPDDKIPRDRDALLTCPKCKNKIVLKAGAREGEGGREEQPLPPKDSLVADEAPKEDDAFNFFDEGKRLALILENNQDYYEKIQRSLTALDYTCLAASDTREATTKMRFHQFDLVVLADWFDGQQLEKNPTLNYINRLAMSLRRRMFLALLGDRFRTMDNMAAFALSANVVVNRKDLDRLGSVLKKTVSDNGKFYKVFLDELTLIGKA